MKIASHQKDKVEQQIVNIIEQKNKGHLSTGLIGTQWLMRTLTDIGREDLAFRIATQKSYPSWGYMLENGATAIWELWNGNTANPKMNSQNHVMMLGDLLIWYYESLLGIKSDAEYTGYRKIVMKPELIQGLNFARGSYRSVYGNITSDWKKDGKSFSWNISVPANTRAIVFVPASSPDRVKEGGRDSDKSEGLRFIRMEGNRAVFEVGSGNYSFRSSSFKL